MAYSYSYGAIYEYPGPPSRYGKARFLGRGELVNPGLFSTRSFEKTTDRRVQRLLLEPLAAFGQCFLKTGIKNPDPAESRK